MDALAAIVRSAASLVAVLGLLYLITRWLRRRAGIGAGTSGEFAVLSRQNVGPKAAIALVRVGDRALVVGITEQGVSLLAETDVASVLPAQVPVAPEVRTVDVAGPAVSGAAVSASAMSGPVVSAPSTSVPAMSGSALSPATWTKAVDVLRERTTRR